MAKSIKIVITLQIPAGKATPAPPVGTALGPHGINIGDFVKKYNDATRAMEGEIIPVQITIYEDRSFDFKLKTPPASDLLASRTARRSAKYPKPTSARLPSGRWKT